MTADVPADPSCPPASPLKNEPQGSADEPLSAGSPEPADVTAAPALDENSPGPSIADTADASADPAASSAEPATLAQAQTADTPPTASDLSPAACAARLAELFPAVFTPGAPRPLKLRIQADLQQRAPGVFTRKALSAFLHRHTTSTAYLRALADAAERIDLDGVPAGPVNDEHRQAAAAELQRRRALHDERRAAQRDAQRKAHDERRSGEREAERKAHEARRVHEAEARRVQESEARRAREADGAAFGERAALLRAYETSTLTRANFCALKGIAETELEAALVQARQDREQRAQVPRPRQPDAGPAERDPHARPRQQPGRPLPADARPAGHDPRAANRKQPDGRPRGAGKSPR